MIFPMYHEDYLCKVFAVSPFLSSAVFPALSLLIGLLNSIYKLLSTPTYDFPTHLVLYVSPE